MAALYEKMQKLEGILREMGTVAVAFSSGVDSTFLLKVAHDVLGDGAVAVTARSPLFPARELDDAVAFCKAEGIEQIIVDHDALAVGGFSQNPEDRCYICKRALFSEILDIARGRGISHVAEGSNLDDLGDYRPGMRAVAELGIESPLRAAELTKAEIRALSRELGLNTWSKPSFACLASRFPYGNSITEAKLRTVERAEQFLMDLGFEQMRVRVHGDIARIEVERRDFDRIIQPDVSERISQRFRELGFAYTALDLQGYRTGSMNETIAAGAPAEVS